MRRAISLFAIPVAIVACGGHGPEPGGDTELACSPIGDLVFHPPVGFDSQGEAEVYAAAEELNRHFRPGVRITFSRRSTRRIFALAPRPIPLGFLTGEAIGGDWSLMLIAPGWPVYGIALHEFAHFAGLEHIPHPGSVMCSQALAPSPEVAPGWCGPESATVLTGWDLAECARVGACCPGGTCP